MRYSAGVWMGNFTGETVLDRTGSSVPAMIVRDTLNVLHGQAIQSRVRVPGFPAPEDWQLRSVCAVSGMDPALGCLSVINEFIHRDEERTACTWHIIVNGGSETIYPAEYQTWFNASVRQGIINFSSRPLEIVNPRDGFTYLSSHRLGTTEIPVEAIGGTSDILHITHNDMTFTVNRPFVFFLPRIPGVNTLHIQNGHEEKMITFTVER
jgi:penicillin-binding protein 1C